MVNIWNFVFLSGDGLLSSFRDPNLYDHFEKCDSWIISDIDGSYITIKPIEQ